MLVLTVVIGTFWRGLEVSGCGAGLEAPFEADGLASCKSHGSFRLVAVSDAPEYVTLNLVVVVRVCRWTSRCGCGWPMARI